MKQLTSKASPTGRSASNPILAAFREEVEGSGEIEFRTFEWLFQLGRHWDLWQSPRIGTFPIDRRDPSGPASREDSEANGEDREYWEIDDVITAMAEGWDGTDGTSVYPDAVQDCIQHATAVLDRLDSQFRLAGRTIS